MAKTPTEFEQEFIQTAKEKTGKSLEEWLAVVKPTGYTKQMEILNWLKKEHRLNHMQAQFVAGIFAVRYYLDQMRRLRSAARFH